MSPSSTSPRPRARRTAGAGSSRQPRRRVRPARRGPARQPPRGGAYPVPGFLRSPWGIVLSAFLVTVLVALLVLSLGGERQPEGAQGSTGTPASVEPDATGFNAANIIDDAVFYDSDAMSLDEIESFVSEVNKDCVPGSDGTPCLAQATFRVEGREPTTFCPGGVAAASEASAAAVVWRVAKACDINPQVLLVLIHKEQGLLTASGGSLSARDYEAAAGYGCPDGAECDNQWAGFFRQLYGAASQFQRYRLDPRGYDVVAGRPTQVAYSPQAECGSAELTVVNQATAGLYNYTPFQPNAAVRSGGDECTSWGNWNFYGFFKAFFGDPTPSA